MFYACTAVYVCDGTFFGFHMVQTMVCAIYKPLHCAISSNDLCRVGLVPFFGGNLDRIVYYYYCMWWGGDFNSFFKKSDLLFILLLLVLFFYNSL